MSGTGLRGSAATLATSSGVPLTRWRSNALAGMHTSTTSTGSPVHSDVGVVIDGDEQGIGGRDRAPARPAPRHLLGQTVEVLR